jgi:transposase-like protein
LIISDACLGLVKAAGELFPEAQWQRCVVHFYRNVFSHVPTGKVAEVARLLKAIHAQEDRRGAEHKVANVITKLKAPPAKLVETTAHETFTYFAFPSNTGYRLKPIIRSNASSGTFGDGRGWWAPSPTGHSALMLVAARLRHIASTKWGTRRYLAMDTLVHPIQEEAATA